MVTTSSSDRFIRGYVQGLDALNRLASQSINIHIYDSRGLGYPESINKIYFLPRSYPNFRIRPTSYPSYIIRAARIPLAIYYHQYALRCYTPWRIQLLSIVLPTWVVQTLSWLSNTALPCPRHTTWVCVVYSPLASIYWTDWTIHRPFCPSSVIWI
jgi:hypothetical protein